MIQLAPEPTGTELGRIRLHLPPAMHLDDDLLFAFCEANRDLRIERDAHGDLEIVPPTGAETGARNADLNIPLEFSSPEGRFHSLMIRESHSRDPA
jgi:Uma2 family endonuclease